MTPNHQEISQRAYEIWEQSGRPEGRDMDHWLQAERVLQHAAPATPRVASTPSLSAARGKTQNAIPSAGHLPRQSHAA